MWLALMPTRPWGTGYWVNVAHPEGRTTKVTTRFPVHRPNQFRPAWGIEGYPRVVVAVVQRGLDDRLRRGGRLQLRHDRTVALYAPRWPELVWPDRF